MFLVLKVLRGLIPKKSLFGDYLKDLKGNLEQCKVDVGQFDLDRELDGDELTTLFLMSENA